MIEPYRFVARGILDRCEQMLIELALVDCISLNSQNQITERTNLDGEREEMRNRNTRFAVIFNSEGPCGQKFEKVVFSPISG